MGKNGDWKREGYRIVSNEKDDEGIFTVYACKGEMIVGEVAFKDHGQFLSPYEHCREMEAVEVDLSHRRKGLASAMYVHAEKKTGKMVVPSTAQSKDGKAFWGQKKRHFGNPLKEENSYDVFNEMIRLGHLYEFESKAHLISDLKIVDQRLLIHSTARIPERLVFFKIVVDEINDLKALEYGQGIALAWAAEMGLLYEVRHILECGLDPNLCEGRALQLAYENDREAVAELLVRFGADIGLAVKRSLPKNHFEIKDLSKKSKK